MSMDLKSQRMKWSKSKGELRAYSDQGYVINRDIFSPFCIAYLPVDNGGDTSSRIDIGSFNSTSDAVNACNEHFFNTKKRA